MSKNMCSNCEKGPVQCYYTEDALIECKYFKEKAFDSIMRGLEEVKAMQEPKYGEWISFNDRKPDKEGLILLCFSIVNNKSPMIREGWYRPYSDSITLYPSIPEGYIDTFTHWMPFPEPPKEV